MRIDNLICLYIFQYAILMDTWRVCESVTSNDCFIGLYRHIHQAGYHTAGRINLLRIDIGLNIYFVMALNNHGDFFESSISCTFANTVDGNFHLTRTVQNTGYRIGSSHTQVIMTVSRKYGIINAVYMVNQVFYLGAIFWRQAVTCCIRDIHYGSSRFDDSFYHTCQIFVIRTACVFCIKFHIVYKTAGIFHSSYCTFDNLFTIRIEFIFNVRIRSTDTGMNTFMFSKFQCIYSNINIFLNCTCQSTDSRPSHRFWNLNHWIKISRARNGESGFNHVYSQRFQCLCYLNLLYCIQLASRNLFTISKSGIKNK